VRHAARINFVIEPATWQAIKDHLEYLLHCPESRIRDELLKDLKSGASSAWAALAMDCGLFSAIFSFYPQPPTAEVRSELLANLAVADRLLGEGVFLAEHFLLALLLLPWTLRELDLLAAPGQGPAGFNFAREVRNRLDHLLTKLNFTKGQKEGIAVLLVNLPVFAAHADKENLPKWLTRKSYFPEGLLFYQVYQEAQGGLPVTREKIGGAETAEIRPGKPSREKPARRRAGRSPVMLEQSTGGIFGFKKK
jgi:poly(A) polymerase